jgi:hypothetical protein
MGLLIRLLALVAAYLMAVVTALASLIQSFEVSYLASRTLWA